MDKSEQLAEKYLVALNIGIVVFEPDGNIPPDFVVAGNIGVEVRRLNQNFEQSDGSIKGLEDEWIPLWQGLKQFFPTLGTSVNGESWFVGLDFRRPVGNLKLLKEKIRCALREFMQRSSRGPVWWSNKKRQNDRVYQT